ncbi:putative Ig domain-containing protein [Mesorhizobium sp. ANAO-SY3R2]|uniref:putative Ig domain-containing protein n=1 Tax=Mesorhizobium sp. ANAO-SY3R2 TaxID=3166644 RepID=UPI00366B2775
MLATLAHKIAAMMLALLATLVLSLAAQASSGLTVEITSISPSSGSATGGSTVTITGQNLGTMPTVRFGGVEATSYISISPTELVVTTPTHAAGAVDVSVVTLDGSTTSTGGFTYGALQKPVATSFTKTVPMIAASSITPVLSGDPADYITITGYQPVVGTLTASGTTINYTPSGSYCRAFSFTYTATNSAGTSAPVSAYLRVYPDPAISLPAPGPLAKGNLGAAYSQSVAAQNGRLPYTTYNLYGTLPAGLTFNSTTGAISGTPTAVGKANISIGVEDACGVVASASYSIDIAPRVPLLTSVSPAKGAETGGTNVTINGWYFTGATSVTFGDLPAAQFSVSSDRTISAKTPAHAAGAVDVVVTTPGGTVRLPNGFTYDDLPAPIANAASATVDANSSANPITLNVTGGAAASVTVASPASHGTATASGATITYTPTAGYSGSDSFTYTATNATGTSSAATVTVTVSAPTFAFAPASGSLPNGKVDDAYSQALSATAGTAPYSYAVTSGALPAGLAIDPVTGTISGTPSAAGEASFTVTATDAYGASGSATYSLDIKGVLRFTPAGGALPAAMAGEDYTATASAGGTTGTVIYGISGTLPDGMVLNVSTGALSGPLAANATLGSYHFTISAIDSTGATGSASYTLEVLEQDITARDKEVDVPAGSTPNTVYLNSGATGGPFTGAAVAYVNPSNAGTAEIIQGEVATLGSFVPVGYYLKFTPNRAFSGKAVVGYTLTSGFGTSNTGTVTYRIAVDVDEVASDISGMVHGFVKSRQNLLSSSIALPGLMERRRAASAGEAVTTAVSPSADGANLNFSTSLAQVEAARQQAEAKVGETVAPDLSPFNVWASGTFQIHNREENDNRWGSFALFSSGADYLISDKALVGLSFHYDRMSYPTDEDAKLTGNGWLVGPYASFEIGQGVFLDTSLLYGGSANDIDTRFYDGTFDTRRWMSDTSLKGQWLLDEATTLTPKLRAVYLNERVDDYDVSNGTTTIGLEGFSEEQLRLSAGFNLERIYELESGLLLTPSAGLNVGYSAMDGDGTFASLSAGLVLSNNINWNMDLSVLVDFEGEGQKSAGGKLGVSGRF